jgi:hypothetical protein
VDSIPKSVSGKILRKLLWQGVVAAKSKPDSIYGVYYEEVQDILGRSLLVI